MKNLNTGIRLPQKRNKRVITILVLLIAFFASIAAATGILSVGGPGFYQYTSIRGKEVTIYGKGLYKHMSAEVAPQGIAQDAVTLFFGVPLLIIALVLAQRNSARGRYLLAGTLGYFLVTYLFYTVMGMYNQLFLVYVLLLAASFYSFMLVLLSVDKKTLSSQFKPTTPFKTTGSLLIVIAVAIGFLWLSIVVPPLADGTIIPLEVEHYTTLIVQGLDLGILLPAAVIIGVSWMHRTWLGYLLAPVYFVFLSILMTALSAKVVAMTVLDYNVVPAIFIIPAFNLLTLISTIAIFRNIVDSPNINKRVFNEKALTV